MISVCRERVVINASNPVYLRTAGEYDAGTPSVARCTS
jgi:hypothetical protein